MTSYASGHSISVDCVNPRAPLHAMASKTTSNCRDSTREAICLEHHVFDGQWVARTSKPQWCYKRKPWSAGDHSRHCHQGYLDLSPSDQTRWRKLSFAEGHPAWLPCCCHCTFNCRRLCRNPNDFDFIECFTTTFLRAHSWLNWVDEDDDEDEVGLKEKPEDTRYINKITSK